MIRLTLNASSGPETHLFNKSTISIGAEPGDADLTVPGLDIQSIHVKIVEQNEFPILINCTNDPFVLVNGHAFGKKLLNSGDIISIHEATLLFEILHFPAPTETNKEEEAALDSLADKKSGKQDLPHPIFVTSTAETSYLASLHLPFEKETEALKGKELSPTSLDHYLKEFELLKESSSHSAALFAEPHSTERKQMASLKDDYLRDLEDDNQTGEHGPFSPKEPSHLYQAWKWILLFIFSLLAISGAAGTIIYFTVSDKKEAQETKAAQGVADIAMALMHAQLNYLKPHNHNWSDVDFLKNNLQAILPDTPSYASQIDAQGQFNCCPYSLRIYTSSDLSHFLLIAQPAPSLLNWLIPQSLIVVDSQLMELRILKDVRSLNRLLANPDPLDGLNGKEITSLIKKEGLIRLNTLANDSGHIDFAPPKSLAWIRPGVENFIYNAPRYYRLGYPIIKKAMMLSTSKGSSQEVADLKQDVENLSWLNHCVLYSDQGKKSAILARQGLMLFAPSDKLLFGYLLFNAQGKIHQVHLLKDEDEWKESALVSTIKEGDSIALPPSNEIAMQENIVKRPLDAPTIDSNHPIYIQMQSLVVAREQELKPLTLTLTHLINQELQIPRPQFQLEFQQLSSTYLMANAKHKQIIKEAIDRLYRQYEDVAIHDFLAFIKALKLENLIQQDGQSLSVVEEHCQQNIEILLTNIEKSQSLMELDHLIYVAGTWLNFHYIKDLHVLIKYQNLLRNHLLAQLEKYLLSQKKHFLAQTDDREALQRILNHERLIKSEEREFFLKEFDEILTLQSSREQL